MTPRDCLVSLVLALLPAVCGCASYKTAPVSGRVTLDGKPLPYATVMFVPEAAQTGKDPVPSSVGDTNEDGRYTLVLASGGKTAGAVVGKHKVIIVMGGRAAANDTEPTFHKQLPARYNRRTELECDVPAKGRDDADFPLTSQ
jgi:hypothetical protein